MTDGLGISPILLNIESACVTFGPLAAVSDVSFSLRAGDLLGLIGPNGAGKTTLIRAAAGLQALSRGDVHIMNMPVDNNPEVLRHIGFTPDTPPLYELLTVREYLRFIAMGYDLSRSEADERIDFWLEKVWLSEKAGQRIKNLSRGMRQRVGIARTLLPNPTVIFLDEPAAGLDPAGRAQFRQLLCSLREQGKALIVSSHILADMDEYCSHIGMMSAGRMIHFGTVAQMMQTAHGQRCRYTILLTAPVAGAERNISQIEGVSDIRVEGDRVVLEYSGGRESAAELLRELMLLALPVAAFSANAATLEEAYLRTGIRQVD